ncbi:hypothetical protein H5T58_03610, partial [Candidatus Parcubacteria bacterium]|nr:hypothetical protein [Candidatus Parcubacteria bacterium]
MRKLWILPIVFLLSFSILQVAKAQVGTGTREEFRQSLEEIRRQREQYRLEIRNQISNIRERALQQIQQKREELRERLRFLQDEQKRLIVEKIYNQINRLNTILTDKFLVTLDRLELVLRRIEDRTAMWDERGFDVSEVKN